MRYQTKTAIIDDVVARNIDARLQHQLLDLFESAMKSLAPTLVREAKLDTSDFATAKARGCAGYSLTMRCALPDSRAAWVGVFELNEQRLDVVGHLE